MAIIKTSALSNKFYLQLEYTVTSQSPTTNTSVVNWKMSVERTDNSTTAYTTGWNFNAIINDVVVLQKDSTRKKVYKGTELGSGDITIAHDGNGDALLNISISGILWYNGTAYTRTASASEQLPNIPRITTFTIDKTVASYNDTISLTITKNVEEFTHELEVSCNEDEFTKANLIDDNYTIPLDIATRLIDSTNRIRLRLKTLDQGNLIGYFYSDYIAITTPEAFKPSIEFEVSDLSGHTSIFGGYVKGKSQLQVKAIASLKYGAKINAISLNNINGNSLSIENTYIASGAIYTANAIDSRGMKGSNSITPICYEYAPPALSNVKVFRSNENGEVDDDNSYITTQFNYTISPINNRNTKEIVIKHKAGNAHDYTYVDVGSIDAYEGIFRQTFRASADYTFEVEVALQDYFATSKYVANVGTAGVLLNFGTNGKSISIGKVNNNRDKVVEMADGWVLEIPKLLLNGINVEDNLGGTADAELSETSTNAIQNKAVTQALNGKANKNKILYSSSALLQGTQSTRIDVTGYSKLRIYAVLFNQQTIFDLDLVPEYTLTNKLDSAMSTVACGMAQYYNSNRYETYSINVGVSGNTGNVAFKVINCGYTYNSTSTQRNSNVAYGVYKVEGIK